MPPQLVSGINFGSSSSASTGSVSAGHIANTRDRESIAGSQNFIICLDQKDEVCTDMQEIIWARLRDSRPSACLIHAT